MNVVTYSPVLLLLYVWVLLCMLMDVRFRNFTPTQKWLVPLLLVLIAAVNQALYMIFGGGISNALIPLTMHLPYFLLFLRLAKYGVIKTVFMILTPLVFSSPLVIVTSYGQRFFPLESPQMLLSNLAVCVIMLVIVRLVFQRGFHYLLKYGDNKLLLLYCSVPILYYIRMIAGTNVDATGLDSINWTIMRFLPTLNVYVFYFLLLYNYRELSHRHELETTQVALSRELAAAAEQLALLDESQNQAAIYRHDMRHHLTVINGYLEAGDLHQAQAYIHKVNGDIESITPRRFCENRLVDLICSSFASRAEQKGIRLAVEAALPEALPVSDTELCAMISNGLENALLAAGKLDRSRRWVEFFCGVRMDKLLIEIRNPYDGQVVCQDGLPVSSQEGHGHGCRSIRAIAGRSHGMCVFQPEDGVFTFRVAIPL